ncbi:LPS biosynthesis protein, partial [Pseudomonas asiatica]|nr:LPS biosynthesis protein [Pseudomonas asiatica]
HRGSTVQFVGQPYLTRFGSLFQSFLKSEFEYVAHKLDLTVPELQGIFEGQNKTFRAYKNKRFLIGIGARVLSAIGLERRLFR